MVSVRPWNVAVRAKTVTPAPFPEMAPRCADTHTLHHRPGTGGSDLDRGPSFVGVRARHGDYRASRVWKVSASSPSRVGHPRTNRRTSLAPPLRGRWR